MRSFRTPPDRYIARCGHLQASVRRHEIDGAPAFMRGLKLAFASDFHAVSLTTADDARALAAQINALEADIILLGGDYADRAEHAARLFEGLRDLRAPLGCFGIVGNNDCEAWEGRIDDLRALMKGAGCRLLVNRRAKLPVRGGTLYIAGADDVIYGVPGVARLYPRRPSPDIYRVLMLHEPCAVRPAPDLTLSGHTHGGQFNCLGFTPYSIGFERLFGRRIRPVAVAGLSEQPDGSKLLVSKGIGASRIPLRVGVRPEIELIGFV